MFIIKYELTTGTSKWGRFMSINSSLLHLTLLRRMWLINHLDKYIQAFITFDVAYDFVNDEFNAVNDPYILNNWNTYDVVICQLDSNKNIISEINYMHSSKIQNCQQVAVSTDIDDIDYSIPGEAIKAYKQGKKVDWKKVAEKY